MAKWPLCGGMCLVNKRVTMLLLCCLEPLRLLLRLRKVNLNPPSEAHLTIGKSMLALTMAQV
jgi:hypothetical protein